MGRRRIVLCSIVALIAIVLSAAVATVAVVGGLPSERASDLVAAETAERGAVMGPAPEIRPLPAGPATTAITAITARPAVTSPAPAPITTSAPSPASTSLAQTIVPPATTTPPPTAPAVAPPKSCLPAPICFERRPAPEVAPSWTVVENGVTVTARIEPAAPQVGDTVTIFYTAEGRDYCCWVQIQGPNARPIHDNLVTDGTCPTQPATSGRATVEMTMPAGHSFSLWATNGHPCQGPPEGQYPAANVRGTFWVNPLP